MDSLAIDRKLEVYLQRLSQANQQWTQWLEQADRLGATKGDGEITEFQMEAQSLIATLQTLVADRQGLLAEASAQGMPASSLQAVAASLPADRSQSMLGAIRAARGHLEQLKRIHIATWILLRESADFCQDSLLLLMSGKTRMDVTIDHSPSESGGLLLDASL
jgi:hypothetical protein